MQSEAGQDIEAIVLRKELERQSGGGLFCWGIGNAPPRSLREFVLSNLPIDVVFSLMKSQPRAVDVTPKGITVWRNYVDVGGCERPLPPNVLITSGVKATGRAHYALMCVSEERLALRNGTPFDPSAYVNVSEAGRPVGASQVTALVRRVAPEKSVSDYQINLKATLARSFWVKLSNPLELSARRREELGEMLAEVAGMRAKEWLKLAMAMREARQPKKRSTGEQLVLFNR
jgi:hypothetical protein